VLEAAVCLTGVNGNARPASNLAGSCHFTLLTHAFQLPTRGVRARRHTGDAPAVRGSSRPGVGRASTDYRQSESATTVL